MIGWHIQNMTSWNMLTSEDRFRQIRHGRLSSGSRHPDQKRRCWRYWKAASHRGKLAQYHNHFLREWISIIIMYSGIWGVTQVQFFSMKYNCSSNLSCTSRNYQNSTGWRLHSLCWTSRRKFGSPGQTKCCWDTETCSLVPVEKIQTIQFISNLNKIGKNGF